MALKTLNVTDLKIMSCFQKHVVIVKIWLPVVFWANYCHKFEIYVNKIRKIQDLKPIFSNDQVEFLILRAENFNNTYEGRSLHNYLKLEFRNSLLKFPNFTLEEPTLI
jgi:hypothetical protein